MAIVNNITQKTLQPQKASTHWVAIIFILFSLLLAYTWTRTETTQTMLRLSEAQRSLSEKMSYQKALSIERDRLKSDSRIIGIASRKLNLFKGSPGQIVYLDSDKDTRYEKIVAQAHGRKK